MAGMVVSQAGSAAAENVARRATRVRWIVSMVFVDAV
jgi:F0F1-type ATP synthase membrane subunit c/vacuolar-type H+-ATPase subunit K